MSTPAPIETVSPHAEKFIPSFLIPEQITELVQITTHYPNSRVREKYFFKNGKRHGVYFGFYENGESGEHYVYKDGVRHGIFQCFHSNGKRSCIGQYNNGELHGEYTLFDVNGYCLEIRTYENGEIITTDTPIKQHTPLIRTTP